MRLAAFACALACSHPAAAGPRLWGALQPGPYAVGFQRVDPGPRELHVWYPASAAGSTPLTLADYLRASRDLRAGAVVGDRRELSVLRALLSEAVTGTRDLLPVEQASALLSTAAAASADAPAAPGRFPLVFWTQRYGTTVAQHVLNEYLASHGFVVVYAAASQPPLLPYEMSGDRERSRQLDAEVARLRAALRRSGSLPFADASRVLVLAWSYAGESAFALQQLEPRVRAVVGISANVVSDWIYRPGRGAAAARMTRPYLLIDGGAKPEPPVLKNAAAPACFLRFADMAHGSFNVLEGMLPSVAGITTVPAWSKAGPVQQRGYEAMAQYVERAVEFYLLAVPTMDTPFRLWEPDGEPAAAVTVSWSGHPANRPAQPALRTVTFPSADGHTVTADWYRGRHRVAPTIVLAHQSQSSRGEYRQIAPRLVRMGFNALAVDTRWGQRDPWNDVVNETAAAAGTAEVIARNVRSEMRAVQDGSAEDLRGAIAWLRTQGATGPVVLWGSSMSANVVLKLSGTAPPQVVAALAFSPGEYRPDQPAEMQTVARALGIPVMVAYGTGERQVSRPVFLALTSKGSRELHARHARHGASILLDDPDNWREVESFLREAAGRR
jgi:dienelactone hydrolase